MLVTNLVIIFVLLRNKCFLKNSAFIAGLAVSDATSAVTILNGSVNNYVQVMNNMTNILHPLQCMKEGTAMQLVLLQIPVSLIFFIGTERFLAVVRFKWFYRNWSSKKSWTLVCIAYVYGTVFFIVTWIIAYITPSASVAYCTPGRILGPFYLAYSYGLCILAGIWLSFSSLLSLAIFIKRKRKFVHDENLLRFIKEQWQTTVMFACIAFTDFLLIVVPIVLMMINSIFSITALDDFTHIFTQPIVSTRECLNVFIYTVVNSEFRIALKHAFRTKNIDNTVTEITLNTQTYGTEEF